MIFFFVLSAFLPEALAACSSSWSGAAWTGYGSGQNQGGTLTITSCTSGCFVTAFSTYYSGNVDSIKVTCSDATVLGPFGCTNCGGDASTGSTNAAGFTGIQTWGGGNLNGLSVFRAGGLADVWLGGSCSSSNPCGNVNVLKCGTGALVVGVQMYLGGGGSTLNSIEVECATINCPAGSYFLGGACIACPTSSCGIGQYLSGCTGTSSGSCVACTDIPGGAYYYTSNGGLSNACGYSACSVCSLGFQLSGCGGTNAGSCQACSDPGTGNYLATAGSCAATACPTTCSSTYGQYSSCGGTSVGGCMWCVGAGPYSFYIKYGGYGAAVCSAVISPAGNYRSILYPRAPHAMTLPSTATTIGTTFTYIGTINSQPEYFGSNWYLWWWDNLWLFDTSSALVGGSSALKFGPKFDAYSHTSGELYLTEPLLDVATSLTWYLPCASGTYASAGGMSSCTLCGVGAYASAQQLTACSLCAIGYYTQTAGAATCAACSAGSYVSLQGASACALCATGSYSTATGVSTCVACATSTYASRSGLTVCAACIAGTYADVVGYSACKTCASGLASLAGASVCTQCSPGTYTASNHTCVLCSPGTYMPYYGYASCTPCQSTVNFIATSGATVCTPCSVVACGVGYQAIACTRTADAYCTLCPAIPMCYYTAAATCTNADGSPACLCLPGYYYTRTACLVCPASTYKAGNNSATSCSPWSTVACNAGYFRAQGTPFQDSQCVPCPNPPLNALPGASGCAWGCGVGYSIN